MKTTTIGPKNAPSLTFLKGHHDLVTFLKAFKAEGMRKYSVEEDDLSYEYWIEQSDGNWVCSHKGCAIAKPVTVMSW